MRPYTLAEARYILSHVYCAHHVPEEDGLTKPWFFGVGLQECCRCSETHPANLYIHIVSEKTAAAWLEKENAAIAALGQCMRAA